VEDKTPNSSPFAVLDHFFVTSSIREKHRGFRMPKVQKTPSLSLLSKTIKIFRSLAGPPLSQCRQSGGPPSSLAALYKQTCW
jgi:hypothetical protein